MLTSKDRAALRGIASKEDTILQIGKSGIGDAVVKQAADAIAKREIIKGRVLENSLLSAKEAADSLARDLDAEVVQVIGTKFVLYKKNKEHPVLEW